MAGRRVTRPAQQHASEPRPCGSGFTREWHTAVDGTGHAGVRG
ncbi:MULTISPECIES: hypothetical protein [unclassified Pseudomonas]|nr:MULTISPECIES: hypothetical protein [unclassified Pseudomonas]MDD7783112.1 hypothetical protein [Pseudomonas sp. DVZ24]